MNRIQEKETGSKVNAQVNSVWAVCAGEYDDFEVKTVCLTEAEANAVAEKANEMRRKLPYVAYPFYVEEYPLQAEPMYRWQVAERAPGRGMHAAAVVFKHERTFAYKHPNDGEGWSVSGTDYDEVGRTFADKTKEQ